ncbi:putative amidoligase enzyme-domain-containing protein [Annulohypoxylon stygium]|nr:putative amidoligase enzyme-domain-containing protein [Annulohypoxylon stygium]
MSTSGKFPGALRRTFGVELEILVPWLWEDEPDPDQKIAGDIPPILRLPVSLKKAYESPNYVDNDEVLQLVYDTFADMLNAHGLPTESIDLRAFDAGSGSDSSGSSDKYTKWIIKRDASIIHPDGGYKWYGMEIISPVERASPEAFGLVRYVLNVIKSKYRTTANQTCAFHVHVGDGLELMSLDHTRRVAGLLWAADPLLACVHPPHRRNNYYCQSIRERSNLAHGRKAAEKDQWELNLGCCNVYIGGEMRVGESPISWREKHHKKGHLIAYGKTRKEGHFEPFCMKDPDDYSKFNDDDVLPLQQFRIVSDETLQIDTRVERYVVSKDKWDAIPDTPYVSTLDRKTPRFEYPTYDPIDKNGGFTSLQPKAAKDIGVFAGIIPLYSGLTSCAIEWLLRAGDRPNYSFSPYSCFIIEDRETRPGTIEFREAAGTVDGEWAETWARICVGLTQFAIHAPVEEYLSVLININRAACGGAPYDVLDLLDEAGLFAEAVVVEKRLLKNKEEWGLKVIPN